jgi:hypothetical protein
VDEGSEYQLMRYLVFGRERDPLLRVTNLCINKLPLIYQSPLLSFPLIEDFLSFPLDDD